MVDPVVFRQRDRILGDEPETHAATVVRSNRSLSRTAPCHGSIPFGGTNSIVASSPILLSGTMRTSPAAAHRRSGVAAIRMQHRRRRLRTPRCGLARRAETYAPRQPSRGRAGSSPGRAPADDRGAVSGSGGSVGSAMGVRPVIGAADRDALAGFQRADHGPIHVAVTCQRASTRRSRRANVARRVHRAPAR